MASRAKILNEHKPPRLQAMARPEGPLETLTLQESRENARAVGAFLDQVGGRDMLLDTLSVAADAPEVERVVELLLDPRYTKTSLRRLCTMANLTVVDLFAAYKKAMIVQAHLQAYRLITQKLLPVVEDVMTRAAPYTVPCVECGATGSVAEGKESIVCPACHGHKAVIVHPDLDRQKLALELAQLVQKAAGLTVQQNTVHLPAGGAGVGGPGTLVDLQRAVREMLRGPRQPLPIVEIPADPIEGVNGRPAPDPTIVGEAG